MGAALYIRGGVPAVLRHTFLLGDHDMQRLRQLTFASLECDRKKRREIFPERMDSLIPWAHLAERGVLLKEGSIVVVAIISAPSSTGNESNVAT